LRAGRYGWAVGAIVADTEPRRWSRPAIFRVEAAEKPGPPPVRDLVTSPPIPPTQVAVPAAGPHALTEEAFTPGNCSVGGELFADVPATDPFCRWIEQLARSGIAGECSPGNFCPDNPVTRRQLASYLGKSMFGTATWHPAQGSNPLAPPAGNTLTTVEDPPASDVGLDLSMTIGADGLPIISYNDWTASSLKVAHCDDLACAPGGETITAVEGPPANVGQYTAITIGSDGLPIISYRDFNDGALRVAHCDDVACTPGGETITTLDSVGDAGLYTSITIGSDGLPIIS
jgi:hypothetical protein